MLFELLIVGLLRDPISCRMFHRSNQDVIKLELPNSPANKSTQALYLCNLLPTTVLEVTAEDLDLVTPTFTGQGRLSLTQYHEAIFVAKWLRGFRSGKLNPGRSLDPTFDGTGGSISADEVFAHLAQACCNATGLCGASRYIARYCIK